MPTLSQNLILNKCPHCSIANPNLFLLNHFTTNNHNQTNQRIWGIYSCKSCGGITSATAKSHNAEIMEYHPKNSEVDANLPEKPKALLQQAQDTLHAPSGSVMLSASAVDSMLKLKGYTNGSLYSRIEMACQDHLITEEMGQWAHEVRLDANDQRHADESASLPTEADAKRVLEFAKALAEFAFILPSRVKRGLELKP